MTIAPETVLGHDAVETLLANAEQNGSVRQADVDELVELHAFAPLELDTLQHELEARGIDILDGTTPEPVAPVQATPDTTTDALQLFLREAGRHPLLTAAQEVELAKAIERGDRLAKQRMIQSNLRLVVSIAKNYRNQGLPFLDLIHARTPALIPPPPHS